MLLLTRRFGSIIIFPQPWNICTGCWSGPLSQLPDVRYSVAGSAGGCGAIQWVFSWGYQSCDLRHMGGAHQFPSSQTGAWSTNLVGMEGILGVALGSERLRRHVHFSCSALQLKPWYELLAAKVKRVVKEQDVMELSCCKVSGQCSRRGGKSVLLYLSSWDLPKGPLYRSFCSICLLLRVHFPFDRNIY